MQTSNNLTKEDMILLMGAIQTEMHRPNSRDILYKHEHRKLREIYYMLLLGTGVTIHMTEAARIASEELYEQWDYTDYPLIRRVLTKKEK